MLKEFFKVNFPDNSLSDYALFAAVFAGSLIALYIVEKMLVRRVKKARKSAGGSIDPSTTLEVEKKTAPMLYCVAVYLSMQTLSLGAKIDRIVNVLFFVFLGFFGTRLAALLFALIRGKALDSKGRRRGQAPDHQGDRHGSQDIDLGSRGLHPSRQSRRQYLRAARRPGHRRDSDRPGRADHPRRSFQLLRHILRSGPSKSETSLPSTIFRALSSISGSRLRGFAA